MSRVSTTSVVTEGEPQETTDPTMVPTLNQPQQIVDPTPAKPDETFRAMPGGFDEPRQPQTLHHPTPRKLHSRVEPRDIPLPWETTEGNTKSEEEAGEVEDMTRILEEQGEKIIPPKTPVSFTPTGAATTGGVRMRTPPGPAPITVIARALREGLLTLQNHLILETRQATASARTTEVLVQGQDQKIGSLRGILEETRNHAIHSLQVSQQTAQTAKEMEETTQGLNRVISEFNQALSAYSKKLANLEELTIAIEERTADIRKILETGHPRQDNTTGQHERTHSPFRYPDFQRASTEHPRKEEPIREQPSATTQSIPKEARAKKPDQFNGKKGKEAESFLSRMELYFQDYDEGTFSDARKISNTLLNMGAGAASAWAQPFIRDMTLKREHEMLSSWEIFKAKFLGDFSDPSKKERAVREIKALRQTRDALSYTSQFRLLSQELQWNTDALIDQYREGLKPGVKQELFKQEMQHEEESKSWDLETWMRMACRIDDMLFTHNKVYAKAGSPEESRKEEINTDPVGKAGSTIPFPNSRNKGVLVPDEEKDRRRKEGLCIKCGKKGHTLVKCRGIWSYEPKGKVTTGKAAKEEEPQEK